MRGRPPTYTTRQRKARFLYLCAQGVDPVAAQQESGLPVHHAFELVADRQVFDAIVEGLRANPGSVAAVAVSVPSMEQAA